MGVLWLLPLPVITSVQVDAYGRAHGFDYLDYYYNERFGVPGTAYFHRTLNTFYSMGYIEGASLVGIPYDWRLPPWQASGEQNRTKQLRESVAETWKHEHARKGASGLLLLRRCLLEP